MNSLGISSDYSSYFNSVNSVYKSAQVSFVKDKQDYSGMQIPTDNPSSKDEINDEAIISDEAKALYASEEATTQDRTAIEEKASDDKQQDEQSNTPGIDKNLSSEEQQQVTELKIRDTEVRAHEQAHIAAAAGINASAPSFGYKTGPDGKQYAVSGEVNVSFTQSNDPRENIDKAQTMKAAALAPAQPSSQDLDAARSADKIIADAEKQLQQEIDQKIKGIGSTKKSDEEDIIGNTNSQDSLNNAPNDETMAQIPSKSQ